MKKIGLLLPTLVLAAALLGCGGSGSEETREEAAREAAAENGDLSYGFFAGFDSMRPMLDRPGKYAEIFNDSNKFQFAHAKRLGIEPIKDLRGAWRTKRPIVHITSSDLYIVDSLTHSIPYLVPEAATLLSRIGADFKQKAPAYRIRVTSLLRTPASVKSLRRVNVNATDSSTHQYGTTFDLAYFRFPRVGAGREMSDDQLKRILAEVLYEYRLRKECMVKFERKTHCFHITATR